MKRTTIVLPDDLAALLEWERRRCGVSAAAIVREALDAHLARPAGPLPFVALGRSGCHDTAQRTEEILEREWTVDLIQGTGVGVGEATRDPDSERSPEPIPSVARRDAVDRADRDASAAPESIDGDDRSPNGDGRDRRDRHRGKEAPTAEERATVPSRVQGSRGGDVI